MIYNAVIDSINEVLSEHDKKISLKPDTQLRFIMDSMSVLEVLLVLEEKGFETKFIQVDEVDTVKNLVDLVSKCKVIK